MSAAGGRGDDARPSNKDGGGGRGSGRGSGGSSKKESILELAKVRIFIGCCFGNVYYSFMLFIYHCELKQKTYC